MKYLREAARDGWHADEPTDFATLFSRSGVRSRDSYFRWQVDSATIRDAARRLKRMKRSIAGKRKTCYASLCKGMLAPKLMMNL